MPESTYSCEQFTPALKRHLTRGRDGSHYRAILIAANISAGPSAGPCARQSPRTSALVRPVLRPRRWVPSTEVHEHDWLTGRPKGSEPMTAHPMRESDTSHLPLVYGYLHGEEPDEGEIGVLPSELLRHRTPRDDRSATVSDRASGECDGDWDGSS